MADHFQAENRLENLEAKHPRILKGALERMLEDGRVRAEEPEGLRPLVELALKAGSAQREQSVNDYWLDQIKAPANGQALDQVWAAFFRQAELNPPQV
ncbi:hypothetical protein COW36_20180 [bacterium (Candidatus Blackallbacteria) CG17_big_fil_post_rev_8_21_14_2_50_48_46]|uniref:Uncharacterized protein n=1 Tax=bacterium (Candidatus Blackallbacteria) CG17_big_fil_post_rev_8_21_14_2_50_48_46 TaxID=2014261 RepID=A0A2M7FZ93_9BACT|nr:MAG: hypothetical protein COW64_22505 [bacterium (Candidatus Blackallbacteria) CG18_big_fil_WC_8_21_14_2_50_49_26]PIW14726.1 MAG: hypothetical protein COW36_20180 [bacterium (Candidatus Blackallbacteria) CG17_big_fil_post_rev_8_21_14_2_50_48_46]PIW50828.1 MAG: hypothetical protein COW20_00995 [bacterium (Candidatus Blackallbacteria) CG13_big_fil_rev_8_21_14_2_50_49_14]